MTKRKYGWVLIFAVWRAFQAAVVIPASMVGTVLLVYAMAGQAPVQTLLEGIYQFAETSVRPASAGMVLVTECAEPGNAIKTPICESTHTKEVPVGEAVSKSISMLTKIYLTFVIISVGGMLIFEVVAKIWTKG